jgi:hypothetical protein
MIAKREGQLFKVHCTPEVNKVYANITKELVHLRFGHPGHKAQRKLSIGATGKEPDDCEACVKAKQPQASFKPTEERAKGILDLLHSDVIGPVEVPSLSGSRYVTSLLDDKTGYGEVGIHDTKSQAGLWIQERIERWETRTEKKVKILRTDRGMEFIADLEGFLNKMGIEHQTSTAYTPQQNGRAERLNRTPIEKARAMMLTHDLPKEFWAAAMRTAATVRNMTPAASETKTPYELFHGKKADISRLSVFGCKAFALVPKQKRKKFDPRAESGVFIGYAESSKAWNILVWRDGKPTLVETASARFFEDQKLDLSAMKVATTMAGAVDSENDCCPRHKLTTPGT